MLFADSRCELQIFATSNRVRLTIVIREISTNELERFGRLEVGLTRPLLIRNETITSRANSLRLAYVSDLHLRRKRSMHLCQQILDACQTAQPDVIVLGGDYVDQRSELAIFGDMCRQLNSIAPVVAIAGNHDVSIGLDRIRKTIESAPLEVISLELSLVKRPQKAAFFQGIRYEWLLVVESLLE